MSCIKGRTIIFGSSDIWWRFSTWEKYHDGGASHPEAEARGKLWFGVISGSLMAHIVITIIWAVSSGILTIQGFNKYHKRVGYIAVLSGIGVALTANSLQLETISSRVTVEPIMSYAAWQTFFHAVSNFQVGNITVYLLGFGVHLAKLHQKEEHQKIMGTLHLLIAANFMPRVTSVVFRFLLPTHDGPLAFTFAAALQWYSQIVQGLKSRKSKKMLIKANAISVSASCVLVIVGRLTPEGYNGKLMNVFGLLVLGVVGVVGWKEAKKETGNKVEKTEENEIEGEKKKKN
jgi:hypothetical protein